MEKCANGKRGSARKSAAAKKIAMWRLRALRACDNSFVLPQRFEFAMRAE
jgi:hypothetical protein